METGIRWLSLGVILLLSATGASAQSANQFPTSAVRILIPSSPGGATDFIARLMQTGLSAELGQSVLIDNRGGAGGKIAVEATASAPPDGYTMLFGNIAAIAVNPAIFRSHPVNTVRDLICVSVVAESTAALVVHSSVPVKSVKELIQFAKARPGQLNYAAASAASPARLGMEVFTQQAGINIVGVTYKGGGEVAVALLSGEVALASASLATVFPYIKSGKLRALAIKSRFRSNLLPEVPSFAELGYPEQTMASWQALFLPAKTPLPIVEKLHAAIGKVIADPQLAEKAKPNAMAILKHESLKECADFTKSQVEAWARIVKQVGITGSM